MISSRRTYHTISIFVAFALLLSVGMPLVHYVCGATGKAVTTLPVASSVAQDVSGGAAAPCGHVHKDVHAALCADMQQVLSGCEEGATCTVESEKQEPALSPEAPTVRLGLVPALVAEQILPLAVFSSRPTFQWDGEAVGALSLVPIRLLTSTFLL